jgi:hypothetical protein
VKKACYRWPGRAGRANRRAKMNVKRVAVRVFTKEFIFCLHKIAQNGHTENNPGPGISP